MSPRRAFTELFFASALWGFGFIATVWALQSYSPLWITALRFSLAFAIGLIPIVLTGARREFNRANFKLAFQPGILIALTLIAQTWGLQYTTATKSAFLTVLYVLIVPAIESVFRKAKLPRFHFFFVTIAILGVALICGLFSNANASDLSKTEWNRGDAMTLVCAVFASLQIEWFGRHQKQIQSAFVFNVLQSFWAGLLALAAIGLTALSGRLIAADPFSQGALNFNPTSHALFGLTMLTLGSTLIAFALQVRAQKVLSPSIASLLFLLESPFSAIFAFFLLNETFQPPEIFGGILIFLAVILASRSTST
jgi:drug/metabolite transporter (DMT)-like permease